MMQHIVQLSVLLGVIALSSGFHGKVVPPVLSRLRLKRSSVEKLMLLKGTSENMDIEPLLNTGNSGSNSDFVEAGIPVGKDVAFKLAEHKLNGSEVRVGIIVARENTDIVENLYAGVNESLAVGGVQNANIFTTSVPSCFDLPITARLLAASKRVDVIIAIGCLLKVKGSVVHFEKVAEAVTTGLMKVSIDCMVPCIHGVLIASRKSLAVARSTHQSIASISPSLPAIVQCNEGLAWGAAAVEMGLNRMAALGMDKTSKSKKREYTDSSDISHEFVTFRRPLETPASDKISSKPSTSVKKIGF